MASKKTVSFCLTSVVSLCICSITAFSTWAFAEIAGDHVSRRVNAKRAAAWGQILYNTCAGDRVGSLGLPSHIITAKEAEGTSFVISAAQINRLRTLEGSYRAAQMTNHHGSGLAQMRATALAIDRATRATFGPTHLFTTISAACKVPLATISAEGSGWNDNRTSNPIGEAPINLARFILAARVAALPSDDSLVLEARFLLAQVAPPDEASAQLVVLAEAVSATPEQVLTGARDAAPMMSVLRRRLEMRPTPEDEQTLGDLTRYHALARARSIHDGIPPDDWRLNSTAVNEYVPSTPAEVRDEELTVAAMEAAYGKDDAELAGALYVLGQHYRSAGRRDEALTVLTRALALADARSALPQRSWQGAEVALKAYIEAELGMVHQQDGRFDAADRHFSACLRLAKAADKSMMLSSCTSNLDTFITRQSEARNYGVVDRDMRRARTMLDRELGPDSNEWYDFGVHWADSYKARGDRLNEALQMRELVRRRPDIDALCERLTESAAAAGRPDLAEVKSDGR